MLFSILIPTYNNEKTIARTIESALNQDYNGDYEIVIVNNASTDATLSVIESYDDPKIKVISNPSTVHMYENHNICIKNALGDYVIFCHSDDRLMPEALKILYRKIDDRMYPQRYMVWGHSMFRDYSPVLHQYDSMLTYNMMFSGRTAKLVMLSGGLTPSGTCYSRKLFEELKFFPVIEGTYDIDWVFGVIAAYSACEFEMIDRILFYRTNASTYVNNVDPTWRRETIKKAADLLLELVTDEQKNEIKSLWETYHFAMLDYNFNHTETRDEKIERYQLLLKRQPWNIKKMIKLILLKLNVVS